MENARKGAFDSSPLLSTVHYVICPNCKFRQSVVLLEYLRTGKFKIGKTEQIEVQNMEGTMLFTERETFTPIVVRHVCKECSSPNEVKLVSAEYLKEIIDRPEVPKTMYA